MKRDNSIKVSGFSYKKFILLFVLGAWAESHAMQVDDWSMESDNGVIRSRPFAKEDYNFWNELQESPAATALFRDGLPRTAEAAAPQADRSLKRVEAGDPRFIHVVELKTEEFGWKKGGIVVLGGAEQPGYFELAGLSHPAIFKETGEYLKEVDVEALKRGEPGFDLNKPDLIPIWGQEYATATLQMVLTYHLPKSRQTVTETFNGPKYKGIVATSSNPASERLLENFGFVRSDNMEISRYGLPKWTYTLNFAD